MDDWFYELHGRQAGPVSKGELVSLLVAGTINTNTLVWNKTLRNWSKISDLDDEFNPKDPAGFAVTESKSNPLFLYIPVSRLILMNVLSIGFYQVYWIYHNWRFLKRRGKLNVMPFWRAVFSILFIYQLFNEIRNYSAATQLLKPKFSAGPLAACWIIATIFSNMLGRLDDLVINLIGLAITLLAALFFLPVQDYINAVNQALPDPPAYYNKWSLGHIICLIAGLLAWTAILLGLFA
ncbi:MAG: DUF4339 domain-containing protein [Verrucomicrobiales bacterium]|jgi:hypothetical protein|nr:DUF4339 domain-containing protein [Verrucomicrobiales bacterium]